jgi:Transposase
MSQNLDTSPTAIGIDIGKNSFHIVGQNQRGAIVLRQKWSRGQVEARLANLPPCRIGMEACVGAYHLSRTLKTLGHDARLMPAKYVRPYSKGQKNDYRDAEAIADAVQRPTMKFVATTGAGGAGLGTVDARRSDGGFHLSLDAMDHARPRQRRPQGAQYSEHGRRRGNLLQCDRQRRSRPELVFCL